MSMLGTRTKKVTTYGRKPTRIINVHSDFSPPKPTSQVCKNDHMETPVNSTRIPLQSKAHLFQPNAPSTPVNKSRKFLGDAKLDDTMPCKMSPYAGRNTEVTPSRRVGSRVHKVRKPRSPLHSPMAGQAHSTTVCRAAPKPAIVQRIVEVEIVSRMRQISLDEQVSEPKAGPSKPTYAKLLEACRFNEVLPFESVLCYPAFWELLPERGDSTPQPVVKKLGEASYSEVFSVSATAGSPGVVVKVVPLLRSSSSGVTELPDCSEVEDVRREIDITSRMSLVPGGGFAEFLGAFVVGGRYPQQLLDAWDEHKARLGSQSIRPDVFASSQHYALIVLENGGMDLESFQFELSKGWVQAASVFWQVADALARAEEWTKFEHRDLHEGQVLIRPVDFEPPLKIENYLDWQSTGVQTTVIDFGLSRLDMDEGAASTPPPPEVFEGVGDQWDVYRAMRDRIGGDGADWTVYNPITNALWLRYLVGRLLRATPTLRKPYSRREGSKNIKTAAATKACAAKKRVEAAWTMLTSVDVALTSALSQRPTRGQMTRDLSSARTIMAWGREQGWVL